MKLTVALGLRRYLNSPHHPMNPYPKKDRFWKRERIFRFTAWSWAEGRDAYRRAILRAQKIWEWETIKREDEPKMQKYWAFQRLKAACAEHKMELKHFFPMLRKAKIELSPEILSTLAIWEPRSFKSLVMLTKQMALEGNWDGVNPEPKPDHVLLEGKISALDQPIPKAVHYPKGPTQNFRSPPRKLTPEEF